MKKISEHQVQTAILEYLKIKRVFHWRNNSGSLMTKTSFVRFGQKGSPDIMALRNGTFYAIEVKSPSGRLSEFQKCWLAVAEANGAVVIVAHSLDEFIKLFEVK